jgi:hypothetical protein
MWERERERELTVVRGSQRKPLWDSWELRRRCHVLSLSPSLPLSETRTRCCMGDTVMEDLTFTITNKIFKGFPRSLSYCIKRLVVLTSQLFIIKLSTPFFIKVTVVATKDESLADNFRPYNITVIKSKSKKPSLLHHKFNVVGWLTYQQVQLL